MADAVRYVNSCPATAKPRRAKLTLKDAWMNEGTGVNLFGGVKQRTFTEGMRVNHGHTDMPKPPTSPDQTSVVTLDRSKLELIRAYNSISSRLNTPYDDEVSWISASRPATTSFRPTSSWTDDLRSASLTPFVKSAPASGRIDNTWSKTKTTTPSMNGQPVSSQKLLVKSSFGSHNSTWKPRTSHAPSKSELRKRALKEKVEQERYSPQKLAYDARFESLYKGPSGKQGDRRIIWMVHQDLQREYGRVIGGVERDRRMLSIQNRKTTKFVQNRLDKLEQDRSRMQNLTVKRHKLIDEFKDRHRPKSMPEDQLNNPATTRTTCTSTQMQVNFNLT